MSDGKNDGTKGPDDKNNDSVLPLIKGAESGKANLVDVSEVDTRINKVK